MRAKAFGEEPEGTLLDSKAVARAALDTLLSDATGHVVDLRRDDPTA
jgi:2-C-methyl-D-erythritol 4-phosphate cytidylyltransferase